MSFLVDTNVFLEILLEQDKKELCKDFLTSHADDVFISDFSLHSIGVILFRHDRAKLFNTFLEDILDKVEILSLSKGHYREFISVKDRYKLDFDDSYQFLLSKENGMTIATQDKDFEAAENEISILFL